MASEITQRRFRLGTVGIFFAVAAILLVIIIPPVATDTFRGARREAATTAFAVSAILHALLGIFAFRSFRSTGKIPAWAGVFGLILGLALLDAAFAFRAHGPALRVADAGMFVCAFSDFASAGLVFALGFFRSRVLRKPARLFE